ncbi:hypothetical protein BT93_B1327 [Corymbia citriodora subsp. variegata]|nr:hypothetical protein BT93_B1327 [Corymbia citriodora subsp. variegata]
MRASENLSLALLLFLLSCASSLPYAAAQAGGNPSPDSQNPYNYTRFSPSMAVIIVVLIAALFFMAFFSIYIRHCNDANSGSIRAAAGTGRSRRGGAPRGLDPAVIATFPTLVYADVKGLKIGKGALECAVCLNEFEDDETLRLIPKCDHVFHPECVDAWLTSHVTCPVCRSNLVPQPGEAPFELPELTRRSELAGEDEENRNRDGDLERAIATLEREDGDDVEAAADPHAAEPPPEVVDLNKTLNRNRTRGGSRSSRMGRRLFFPRSHSTGHSLVQPGADTERFTLRLPVEVRKQIVNRQLNRTMSMVVLPREGSSRRGYRASTSAGEGSNRFGRYFSFRRLDRSEPGAKSDRWFFGMVPPLFSRASSLRSPRVAAAHDDGGSLGSRLGRTEAATSNGEPPLPPV